MESKIKSGETYWVIKTCPDGATCMSPPSRNITNSTPVTSLLTKETYISIECAFCNHELLLDLVLWKLKKICKSRSALLTRENPEKLFKSVFNQVPVCNVGFIPPVLVENASKACRAYTHDVKCEDRTNNYLINACRQYYLPYYIDDAVYKNIYCAKCTIDAPLFIQNHINVEVYDTKLASFSAVLDFTTDENQSISNKICTANQIYDNQLVSYVFFFIVFS
jgi:hypothetical protein